MREKLTVAAGREYAAELAAVRGELHAALEDAARWRDEDRRRASDAQRALAQRCPTDPPPPHTHTHTGPQSDHLSMRRGARGAPVEAVEAGQGACGWVPKCRLDLL